MPPSGSIIQANKSMYCPYMNKGLLFKNKTKTKMPNKFSIEKLYVISYKINTGFKLLFTDTCSMFNLLKYNQIHGNFTHCNRYC